MTTLEETVVTLEEMADVLHTQAKELERLIAHIEGTSARLDYKSQMATIASALSGMHVRLKHLRQEGGKAPGGNDGSLRDWLAGQALTGLLGGPNAPKKSGTESAEQFAVRVAEESYIFANAMLRARGEAPAG